MFVSDPAVADDRQGRQPLAQRAHGARDRAVVAIPRLDEQGVDRLLFRAKHQEKLVETIDELDDGSSTHGIADPATLIRAQNERHHDWAAALRRHVPVS
jgi:hypothetical protein